MARRSARAPTGDGRVGGRKRATHRQRRRRRRRTSASTTPPIRLPRTAESAEPRFSPSSSTLTLAGCRAVSTAVVSSPRSSPSWPPLRGARRGGRCGERESAVRDSDAGIASIAASTAVRAYRYRLPRHERIAPARLCPRPFPHRRCPTAASGGAVPLRIALDGDRHRTARGTRTRTRTRSMTRTSSATRIVTARGCHSVHTVMCCSCQ